MRPLSLLNLFRDTAWENRMGHLGDDFGGAFKLKSCIDNGDLRIIASNGLGWDHVSVSRSKRCPNWPEMEQVKHLFFRDSETAMQLHVPASDHVNCHPFCLHLWRPHDIAIPRPPSIMVGPSEAEAA
jgi:hypothetical protein